MTLPPLNAIDALLALIILVALWRGWAQGFVVAALRLLVLAVSVAAAFFGYRYLATLLQAQAPFLDAWAAPLSFLASYILAQLVLSALARRMARAVPPAVHAHGANRALGMLPGTLNGLINATIAALLLLTLPLSDRFTTVARDSVLAKSLATPAQWLETRLAPIFDPAIERTLQALTVAPESQTLIPLPFKVTAPEVRPELEARMLEMVNAERARQSLQPLQPDPELAAVARAHSRDMFARSYFSHVSPEGHKPVERLRQARVRFLLAGENLALAPTLEQAHQGLMNSPGHRANVLRPQFGRVGIGVLDGGRYGLMITQNFRN